MRELKFRAWDTTNKVMVNESNVLIDFSGLLWVRVPGTNPIELVKASDSPYVIMQFVGLKDKNEQNIYEGDIVICDRYDNHELYKVVVEDLRNLNRWMFGSALNSLTVVGNIYENPEHLKEVN